jgi:hypothetical protein
MDGNEQLLKRMRESPTNVRFADLCKICDFYFGMPRKKRSSHRVYRTPWIGDPRINIQSHRGKAKAYQVKQVLLAVGLLEKKHEPK